MRIKPTVRYPLTEVRMAIIRKSTNKCPRGWGENRTLLHCWWECKLVQPLWRTVSRFLKKLNIELLLDPAIPLLGINPENIKTLVQKGICISVFRAALFTIAETRQQPKCSSVSEWIKKMWCVYTHTVAYVSAINNEIMPFAATWMQLRDCQIK